MQRLTGSLPTWRLWAYYYSAIAWYLHDVLTMRVTILVPYLLTVLVSAGLDLTLTLSLPLTLTPTPTLPLPPPLTRLVRGIPHETEVVLELIEHGAHARHVT